MKDGFTKKCSMCFCREVAAHIALADLGKVYVCKVLLSTTWPGVRVRTPVTDDDDDVRSRCSKQK